MQCISLLPAAGCCCCCCCEQVSCGVVAEAIMPAVRSRSGSLIKQDLGALALSQLRLAQSESSEPSSSLQDAEWYWGSISRYVSWLLLCYYCYFRLSTVLPGEPRSAGSSLGPSPPPAPEEKFWGLLEWSFFTAGYPSYNSAISVKALKGTQCSNPNQWPDLILSSSPPDFDGRSIAVRVT